MADNEKNSRYVHILCWPHQSVKARVVAAGLRLGTLASAAGIPESTLSGYLSGRSRKAAPQMAITAAFRKLTGTWISSADFWDDLWVEVAA